MNRKHLHKPFLFVALSCLSLALMVISTSSHAQGSATLTPYRKAILDRYYLGTNSSIDGSLIINGTIGTQKLDFAIVLFSEFEAHTNEFGNHTNNASAHHVRFANSEETDQIFTNWLATNAYPKIAIAGDLIPVVGIWTSATIVTSSWVLTDFWTNAHVGHSASLSSTGITINLPTGITGHVDVTSTISADSTANVDAEYAYFINNTRTHTGNFGIVRSHAGIGSIGSITVSEQHDVVDGDFIDLRIRRYQGSAGTPEITVIGGSFDVSGFIE